MGKAFGIKGQDGVWRALDQTPGKMDGNPGVFEYIVDRGGNVTHQVFVKGGVVNGNFMAKP